MKMTVLTVLTIQELVNAIGGLVAYDRGRRDVGIHDDQLKVRVRETLRAMPDPVRCKTLAKIANELYLSDEVIDHTCGLQDAAALWEWLVFNRMIWPCKEKGICKASPKLVHRRSDHTP
jgi:hypothetical protein